MPDDAAASGLLMLKRGVGRPKVVDQSTRVQVSLPNSLVQRLSELQEITHHQSLPDFIRDALTLYAASIEEHKAGGKVYFRRDGENERELALFI